MNESFNSNQNYRDHNNTNNLKTKKHINISTTVSVFHVHITFRKFISELDLQNNN